MANATDTKTEEEEPEVKRSNTWILKEIMFDNTDITLEDLIVALKKRGINLSGGYVANFHTDMQQTIALMKEMGMMRKF
jgi:hypothetical protein